MEKYHKYLYDGPIMEFDRCIDDHWKGETMAKTESKAKTNLAYQYKKMYGRAAVTKISLPGKIKIVD